MTRLWRGIGYGIGLSLPCWALLFAACPLHAQQTRTTPFTDSVTVGDTTRIISGTVSVGVVVNVSSVVVRVTPSPVTAPDVTRGAVIGAWNIPPDSVGTRAYNGGTLPASPTMKSDLDKIRRKGGRVAISVRRAVSAVGGVFNAKTALADIAKWPDLAPYRDIVPVVTVSDDITGTTIWGPKAPYLAGIDSIACGIKQRWPWMPTTVRALPSQLGGYDWSKRKCLDNAWAQYNGPRRDGTATSYITGQRAAASKLGLGVIFGINGLDGGCGPSAAICDPKAPGTGILGTYPNSASVNRYQMSAAEVLAYGTVLLPATCFFATWTYSPTWIATASGRTAAQITAVRNFDNRADVRASLAKLRAMADTLPRKDC